MPNLRGDDEDEFVIRSDEADINRVRAALDEIDPGWTKLLDVPPASDA